MSDHTRTSRPLELDPVDQCPPGGRLFTLALQHVLVMYAGAIAVPLIVGGALGLPKDQIAFLINADLLCCGLVTIIQALGVGRFGIRLPIMMGVTFAAVGPMVAMATNPALGKVSFDGLADVPWVSVVTPLHFGMPIFDPISIATMCLVMVMVESLGMFLALGELTGRQLTRDDLTRGLRTDGLGTLIGGFLNTFPHTSFSQNVGLVGVTGVKSRWVCVAGGAILMAFGLFPKMALIIASVPQYVLGGAGLVMFGMVAATGIKILLAADLRNNRFNLYIVALSMGAGMIPMVAPKFFQQMPHALEPLLHSGILLSAITAVTLNLFLNGGRRSATADAIEPALAH
ncbi:nucleobase:cation symporter-2 family protein [Thauera sp. JM12B12]|uniref:nucleobase:cation symporter-2 family protein n=1 Tax=Thauera sp. JM12B12 TaxID=3142262 RepID=UPI0031F350E4